MERAAYLLLLNITHHNATNSTVLDKTPALVNVISFGSFALIIALLCFQAVIWSENNHLLEVEESKQKDEPWRYIEKDLYKGGANLPAI